MSVVVVQTAFSARIGFELFVRFDTIGQVFEVLAVTPCCVVDDIALWTVVDDLNEKFI